MPAATLPPADFSLLCDVIESVAHRSGLSDDDARDFAQSAHLKLLERNYAPLMLFRGQSSLRTYLTVVVKRLLLDWRNARHGKWRPTSAAQRLGPAAIELERLISRDGHPAGEAVAMLAERPGGPGIAALQIIADQLPRRAKRQDVGPDRLESIAVGFEDPVLSAEEGALRRQEIALLRNACRGLTPGDQQILYLRFERKLTVTAIAKLLGVPAKPLFRRLARILQALRREMVSAGSYRTTVH
jgi:RNA polymerase sigma factor (sigma-70 family)